MNLKVYGCVFYIRWFRCRFYGCCIWSSKPIKTANVSPYSKEEITPPKLYQRECSSSITSHLRTSLIFLFNHWNGVKLPRTIWTASVQYLSRNTNVWDSYGEQLLIVLCIHPAIYFSVKLWNPFWGHIDILYIVLFWFAHLFYS